MNKIALFVHNQYRLDDHPALQAAIAHANQAKESQVGEAVIAFTIRDELPDWHHEAKHRLCGPFRRKFQDQAIQSFQQQLEQLGIPLIVFEGDPVSIDIIMQLKQLHIETIYCSAEHLQQHQWLQNVAKQDFKVESFAGNHLFSDWPMDRDQFPKVFTDFKKKLQRTPDPCNSDSFTLNASPIDSHELNSNQQDPRSAVPFLGGEPSALERLNHYFIKSDGLSQYKKTRNGLIGTEYSSKLSLFLAVGSISVRRVWATIDQQDASFGKNEGSKWMRYELLWREFFYRQSLKYPDQFFSATGIQNKLQSCTPDLAKLESWIHARTGDAFVDACMNELSTTGYLSNRGRQNVASYFVHTLQLPWLWGARYFEWILIDYDRTQNYGNWAYLAGVGCDPRSFGQQGPRYFNTEKQAQDYDPDSAYRNLWKSK